MTTTKSEPGYHLDLEHEFEASREAVFAAWTEPEQLKAYFRPPGYTVDSAEVDLRVGGEYLLRIRRPEGGHVKIFGTYREVSAPNRLVYTWCMEPASVSTIRDTVVTVEFLEEGGRTKIKLHHEAFPDEAAKLDHVRGWKGCISELEEHLRRGE